MKSRLLVPFFTVFLAAAWSGAAGAWEPKKPVELVIVGGMGGSIDDAGRLIQRVIELADLSPRPFIPVNMAGGAGVQGLLHAMRARPSNHMLLIVSDTLILAPIQQPELGIDIDQFAPIALLGSSPLFLWAENDARHSSARELSEMIAERRVSIEGRGFVGRLVATSLAAGAGKPRAGAETLVVESRPSGSGGRAVRSTGLWTNLYVAGAPGMSDDARRYYTNLIQAVLRNERFVQHPGNRMFVGRFLSGVPLMDEWKRRADFYERIQREGLVFLEEDDPECTPECPPMGSCTEAVLIETAQNCCVASAFATCPE